MNHYDQHGWLEREAETASTEGMFSPVRCTWCPKVYDLGTVTVTARYTDCSMWKCPGCGNTVDDRGDSGWKSRKDYVHLRGNR